MVAVMEGELKNAQAADQKDLNTIDEELDNYPQSAAPGKKKSKSKRHATTIQEDKAHVMSAGGQTEDSIEDETMGN